MSRQFIAPIGIGLALFIVQLVGSAFTGASLNPARSFGPAIAAHHFPGYHWIYWIGPLLGSVLATGLYKTVKVLEIETAIALRGESVLGHRRGISNSSVVPPAGAQPLPTPLHVLEPVAEQDLEEGLKKREGEAAGEVAQPHYVSRRDLLLYQRGLLIEPKPSGMTAVNEPVNVHPAPRGHSPLHHTGHDVHKLAPDAH